MDKIIQYAATTIVACTAFVFYLYALFFYRFAFNYETDINGQYFFAFIAVLGFSAILGLNIFRKDDNMVQFIAMHILTLLLLFSVFSDKYSFANEYWAVVLSGFILFVCLLFLRIRIIVAFPYFLFAMVLWQLWLAFAQMDGFSFDAGELTLQGSLQNSGVFSCYLAVHLPLIYWITFHQSISKSALLSNLEKWLRIICFLVIAGFIGFIIYCSQSRSAIVGVFAAIVSLYLFMHGRALKALLQHMPKWAIVTSIGFLIFVGSFTASYLFFLKKASAVGRAMKWEIAGRHIGDRFFTGTGIGRFSWYYPQWQAEYFANGTDPSTEYFLSAGESYIIFNEYLQLFETTGIIGFACFVLLLYWFFNARSVQYTRLLSAIKATVVVLLVTGLTTYPFHVNVLLALLAICFAATAVISLKSPTIQRASIIPMLLFGLNAYATFVIYQKWKAAESWNTTRESRSVSFQASWSRLYKTLARDGKFLTEYGRWQVENGHFKAAIITLEKAKQYFMSRKTMEALATAYEQDGNYPSAIETRKWLCCFLPNRFAPKYELLKLYRRTGDTASVKKMTDIILTMPVKIHSAEVDRIKEEVKINQW